MTVLSVLWHSWLGCRKGIRPVKNLSGEVLAWLSVWSAVQTFIWPSWCHCHSMSLAAVKSRLVLPFWYWLTQVVPDKGPLNVCVLQYDSRVLLFSRKCCLFNFASVLFVYLSAGNICRSPIAEAIFRNEVKKRGLTDQVSVVLFW